MINKTVLADAERETLIDVAVLLVWFNAFDIFAAARVHRIVHEFAGRNHTCTFFWTSFVKEPRVKDAVTSPGACLEIKRFRIRDQVCVALAVFPFAVCA